MVRSADRGVPFDLRVFDLRVMEADDGLPVTPRRKVRSRKAAIANRLGKWQQFIPCHPLSSA
jgi:hypothetical protein